MTVKTVIFVLLFTETSFIYPIFVHVLFRVLYPEKRMKRESGESPEQSRCCKLHKKVPRILKATDYDDWEGLGYRSKSEDLPCVLSEKLARYEL